MGIHIVTGYAGKEHVTSADAGSMNAGIVGAGRYVMQTAEQFAAEIVSNNLIKVKSGDLINQGRHMRIDVNDYEEVTIQNGAQSVYRNDLIVARYKKDTSTLIETTELVVIKGTAGATATDPTYTSGDILAGATQDDFPLYRVSLNGLNIEKVTPLFSTVPNLNELNTKMISKGAKTLGAWQGCSFFNGDNAWLYVYIPGIFVGNNGQKLKLKSPSTGPIRLRAFSKNADINVAVTELDNITQCSYGLMLSFKHSGIGYGGSCLICTEISIDA